MLGDTDLQSLDHQLHDFIRDRQQHQNAQQELLGKFQELVESYRCLRSDYEEEKDAREKYKKLARGQEHNPFVLLLVDGNGYIFKEELVKAGNEGGPIAAEHLSDSVKELLHSRLGSDADQCRITVRIYADLAGLSRALHRAGLVGNEARSLAPFTSSFTRSRDLFDFVDAGDKGGADFKIRETFHLFADNKQCKHIFFAGCHDIGYLPLLTPYRRKADRVTLIKAASFISEFDSLDLPIRELPSVFRSTPIGSIIPSRIAKIASNPSGTAKICKYFPKGLCKYGNKCTRLHAITSQQTSKLLEDDMHQSSLFPAFANHPINRPNQQPLQQNLAALLPSREPDDGDLIPINKNGERLDEYCPAPPPESWELYQQRIRVRKLCNQHHLAGKCSNPNCEFDHGHLEAPALHAMKYILNQRPCHRGPGCRLARCYSGHHCQREGCRGEKPCRFELFGHNIDPIFRQWVLPVDHREVKELTNSESVLEEEPLITL